jgi:phage shock protein A
MANDLADRILTEIASVESEMEDQRQRLLKGSESLDRWDVEVKLRSLRIRLDELNANLLKCAPR